MQTASATSPQRSPRYVKSGRPAHSKRRLCIGVAVAAVAIVACVLFLWFPRGLRGPETVAQNFVEALLQAPDDAAQLRAAAHIDDADDPQALVEGLSARIALDFLRARRYQGAAHDIGVIDARRPGAGRYVTVLRVTEQSDAGSPLMRRFEVSLQKGDNGGWRVVSLVAIE